MFSAMDEFEFLKHAHFLARKPDYFNGSETFISLELIYKSAGFINP